MIVSTEVAQDEWILRGIPMDEDNDSVSNGSSRRASGANLDDVARLAGVSAATASRALNGRAGVKDDVRARVEMVATSLGYRPNRAAQRLAVGRSSVIALLMPTAELQGDPYGAAIVHTVAVAAAERDQGLMVHLATDSPGSAIQRFVRDGQVDGVVLSALAIDDEWVSELTASHFPTVLIGYPENHEDTICVDSDNLNASMVAVRHLADQGRTRIAHIAGPPGRTHSADRETGWRDAVQQLGLPATFYAKGDFTVASGRAAGEELLAAPTIPDAVFAANDGMALGAMDAIKAAGLTVPGDIAVVGFDGLAGADAQPALTTVAQPFAELGRSAVDLLLKRIDRDADQPERGHRVVIEAELVVRESSGGSP